MSRQKTILKEISVKGAGLHTGNQSVVTFKPAPIDAGVVFVRVDMQLRPVIKANVSSLLVAGRSPRRTSIGTAGAEIHTIEHLMAALSGLAIDNIIVEIDNNEVPGLDGSSLNYVQALESAGIVEQNKERNVYVVTESFEINEDGSSVIVLPSDTFKISYTLDYNNPAIPSGFRELVITPETFKNEIAQARTFCLEEEASLLQQQGFGLGANHQNTLVVGKNGVIRNNLRYSDEFVRHKILDAVGDLYLVGCPIKAHIVCLRSGHSLNMKIASRIYDAMHKKEQSHQRASVDVRPDGSLGIEEIMRILPHREPFLFVDRIIHIEHGKICRGIKNVTMNDYFFKGHFPGKPIMPGVIILEAMAQVGGIMMLAAEGNRGKLALFMAINEAKFRRVVVPGDQLVFEVTAGKIKSRTGQVFGKAFVDDKLVAEAELMFAIIEA